MEFISTTHAAEILSLTPRRVTQICEGGTFGTKVGGRWLITKVEVRRYQKNRRPAGRPPQK